MDSRARYLKHSHLFCLTLCFYYIEFELNPFGNVLQQREAGREMEVVKEEKAHVSHPNGGKGD
jgi:hypothetical protein